MYRIVHPYPLIEHLETRRLLSVAPVASPVNLGNFGGSSDPIYRDYSADVNGDGVVVFEKRTGTTDPNVWGQRFNFATGLVGSVFQVDTTGNANGTVAQVIMHADGAFVVAWSKTLTTSTSAVIAQRFNSVGQRIGGEFQLSNGTQAGITSLAAMPDGGLFVSYSDAGGTSWGRLFTSTGVARDVPFQLFAPTSGFPYVKHASADAAGNIQVAWIRNEHGANETNWVRKFDVNGNALSAPIQVKSSLIAAHADGTFASLWYSSSDNRSMFIQRYDANASALGAPLRINDNAMTFGNINQLGGFDSYAIAPLIGGGYLCTWAVTDIKLGHTQVVRAVGADGTPLSSETPAGPFGVPDGGRWGRPITSGNGDGVVFYEGVSADYMQRFGQFSNAGSIGDRVWADTNGNGVQDAVETLGGSAKYIRAVRDDGVIVGTAVTASGGAYSIPHLRPGEPVSLVFEKFSTTYATRSAGKDRARDSDVDRATGATAPVTLAPGEARTDIDAGIIDGATINGHVFLDANANGRWESWERSILGVRVFADANGNAMLDPDEPVSDTGGYSFTGLLPGTYTITPKDNAGIETSAPVTVTVGVGQTKTVPIAARTQRSVTTMQPQATVLAAASTSSGNKLRIDVALDAQGEAVVVWDDDDTPSNNDRFDIFAQRMAPDGTKLGPQFRVNTTIDGHQLRPSVARSNAGGFVITWYSASSIFMRRYAADGTPLTGEMRVNGDVQTGETRPVIAMSRTTGEFVIAWMGTAPGATHFGVYGQRYDESGIAQGGPFRINDEGVNGHDPSIALTPEGQLFASWARGMQSGASFVYEINGRWIDTSNQPLTPVRRYAQELAYWNSRVLALPDGTAAVGWNVGNAFVLQWLDGSGSPLDLPQISNAASRASVAADARGDYRVIGTNGTTVYMADVLRTGVLGEVAPLSGQPGQFEAVPTAVAMNDSGDSIVAMVSYTTSTTPVLVRSYKPSFEVTSRALDVDPALRPNGFSIRFSEDVGTSIEATDLVLTNVTTGTTVPGSELQFSYDTANATARWQFAATAGDNLPSGYYRATLARTAVSDALGRSLPSDVLHKFLWVNGSANADHIRFDNTGNVFLSTSPTPTFTTHGEVADELALVTGAGDDVVEIVEPQGLQFFLAQWDAGDGNDELILNGTGGQDFVSLRANEASMRLTGGTPNGAALAYALEDVRFIGNGGSDQISAYNAGGYHFRADLEGSSNRVNVFESLTLAADVGANPLTTVTVVVADPQARLTSHTSQHIRGSLSVNNHATLVMSAGADKVLFLRAAPLTQTSGTIDLRDNNLIVDYATTSNLTTIHNLIRAARASGSWAGYGITSSLARDNAQHNTTVGAMESTDFKAIYGPAALFAGEAIDSTAVLVKYTYYGDADFNGVVNFDDYSRIDNGFSTNKTGWLNGDFDGNGSVNFDDYSLIDLAFNTQGSAARDGRRRVLR